jgi:hypothetical protein
MKLTNILEKENNALIFEQHMNNSRTILSESVEGMNAVQRAIVEGIYNDLKPLIEASLTSDQVQQLFKGVEQNVSATGNNRTLIGAGKDAVGKANDTINKVGRWLQDTTPVKAFDQKFEGLKTKIGTKFPELDKKLTAMGTWAKENPGKTAAIIGVLTTIAALAGGPVGGAIAGQILRGSLELIKGEKLSTAIGKGIKTAALGFVAGKVFDMLGDWIGGFREQSIPFGPKEAGLEEVSWGASKTITQPGMEWTRTTQGFNALVRPEEAEIIRNAMAGIESGDSAAFDTLLAVAKEANSKEYKDIMDGMVKGAWDAAKDNDSMLQFINGVKDGVASVSQGVGTDASIRMDTPDADASAGAPVRDLSTRSSGASAAPEVPKEAPVRDLSTRSGGASAAPEAPATNDPFTVNGQTMKASLKDAIMKMSDEDGEKAYGAWKVLVSGDGDTQAKMGAGQLLQQLEKKYAKSESIARSGKQLSEGQVYLLFDRVCSTNNRMLSEGKIWEADDPAAPKMSTWEKIKTKASEFGKNLTTKVTASKLNSAWKAAKQPTDSEELAAFLVKQGVNAEVVDKTFVDMKLPKPKSTQAAAEKKPAAEKPAVDAGQGAATGTPAATTPTSATTPTVEKPAVSTSAAGGDVDATPQPNAAGAGPTKNTNTLYSQIRADIKRLDKRSKQQLMSYLEKGLRA